MRYFAVVCVVAAVVSQALCVPWVPEPRNDPNWMARHNEFAQRSRGNDGSIRAVFLGASITDWFPRDLFNNNFGQHGAVNYGISGDGVEHAFWRIQNGELDNLDSSLKLIVFSDCGSNSAGSYNSDDIVRGYTATLEYIRQRLPNVRVMLMALMPRDNGNIDRWIRLTDVNIRNSKWDNGNTNSPVRFLDLWNPYSQAWGVVEPNLFLDDQLHLTREGYEKWVQLINPMFQQMMN